MKHYCKNHPNKKALSLCHSCDEYFCSDCLKEGLEFFYCNKDECLTALNKELSKKGNVNVKTVTLSKESRFIKNIAKIFIVLCSIALIFIILKIDIILSLAFYSPITASSDLKVNIIGFYLFKYLWLFMILTFLLFGILLFASFKIYYLKNRKLFLFALASQILLIILYNVFYYSYLEFIHNTNIVELGYEGYTKYWSIDKLPIAFFSLLFVFVIIYLIKKFASEKIVKEFLKSNA